jgi:hypothetical protein
MSKFSDTTAIPPPASINSGLSPTGTILMAHFGIPGPKKTDCSQPTNAKLKKALVTADVGPFNVTGLKPAVASLKEIFAKIEQKDKTLYREIRCAGMLCCRLIRGSTRSYSIHSWGAAIDLYFGSGVVPLGRPLTHVGVLRAYPYFHNAGFYWGAEFKRADAMHFEVSKEKLQEWIKAKLI